MYLGEEKVALLLLLRTDKENFHLINVGNTSVLGCYRAVLQSVRDASVHRERTDQL